MPYPALALAVGRLDGREAGPRSTVWAEPSQLAAAAWEFAGVEQILAAAEELLGGTRVPAQECFERYRSRYHPIAVTVIGARLGQAARGDPRSGRDG